MRRACVLSWLGICVLSCAGPKPDSLHPPPSAAPAAQPARPAAPPAPAPNDPRALPLHASFGDLVDAARKLDSAGAGHSAAGCLLRGGDEPSRFEADLLPGARPLPNVEAELGPALAQTSGALAVLSAWGNVPGDAGPILLAFTTTTPAAIKLPVIALFMTRAGTFVRGADPALRAQSKALSAGDATTLLSQLQTPAAVYVTAERDMPLRGLVELLRGIPNRFEVALAIALPSQTRLPPAAAASSELLCPDGLPAPARAEHEGELDAQAARAAFAPLREAALSCALATGGRALLGGRLVLGLRIGADGKAAQLCFVSDAIGEPQLRRCLVSAARDLTLPTPQPAGFVDLNVPLEIALEGPSPQRSSCD
jgi:hypothetical protein